MQVASSPRVPLFLACLVLLGACSAATMDNYRSGFIDGQSLAIESGRESGKRFAKVVLTKAPWRGELAGGDEKFGERKQFLLEYAEDEAGRICGDAGYKFVGSHYFEMIESSASERRRRQNAVAATGGGALPALVADLLSMAHTSDENVPGSLTSRFL